MGFGGLLPAGDLFGVVLFSRVHVPVSSAESLALDLGSCLIRYDEAVFAPQAPEVPPGQASPPPREAAGPVRGAPRSTRRGGAAGHVDWEMVRRLVPSPTSD